MFTLANRLPRLTNLTTVSYTHLIVLAVDDAFDDEAMIAVEQILDRLGNTETRVYVVVQALSNNAKQTEMCIRDRPSGADRAE